MRLSSLSLLLAKLSLLLAKLSLLLAKLSLLLAKLSLLLAKLSLLLALATLAAVPAASAQPAPSVLDQTLVRFQAKRGLDYLYDMEFERAYKLFDQIAQRHPDHPVGPFLKALNTWWQILLDLSNTAYDDAFYAEMDAVIARCDRRLKRDPNDFDARFFKGAALGFRGRLRSNRRDWFRAAMDGKRAMDYVLGVARHDPSNADFGFGQGLYDYYADVMPERYPYVRPVMHFFPDGNRARGLRLLQRTAREGYFLQTEAIYFLLQIAYLFEEDYALSRQYVQQLRERHPGNAYFHAFEGRVYARWGDWARSDAVFDEVLQRYGQRRPGYLAPLAEQAHYFLARGAMARAAYRPALDHLRRLDALAARHRSDSYFKVMGRLRQGMAYDALGQHEEAQRRYRQVLRMKDWGGAHDRARRYLERPYRG